MKTPSSHVRIPESSGRGFAGWIRWSALLVIGVAGCNGVLDNDERDLWYPEDSGLESSEHDASTAGEGGPPGASRDSSSESTPPTADADGSHDKEASGETIEDAATDEGGSFADEAAPCTEGALATESQKCGPCGQGSQTRTRVCEQDGAWSAWSSWTVCVTSNECTPGTQDTGKGTCGPCNQGSRSRTRTCSESCTWGEWSDWSACGSVSVECEPSDAPQTQTVTCGPCGGTKGQKRTCTESCQWGSWTDSSACTDSSLECCSEVVYCDTPNSTRGTWCRQKACTREEALTDCKEDIVVVCGATTPEFYMQYL